LKYPQETKPSNFSGIIFSISVDIIKLVTVSGTETVSVFTFSATRTSNGTLGVSHLSSVSDGSLYKDLPTLKLSVNQ